MRDAHGRNQDHSLQNTKASFAQATQNISPLQFAAYFLDFPQEFSLK
jgi:hypothetical protein